MKKKTEKIVDMKFETEEDFVRAVAKDCLENMKEKDREDLISYPAPYDYLSPYCEYLKDRYLYECQFLEDFPLVDINDLTAEIMIEILSELIPFEFQPNFPGILHLYDETKFLNLRVKYKEKFGYYPYAFLFRYKKEIARKINKKKKELNIGEVWTDDFKEEIWWIIKETTEEMVMELAEEVWDTEGFIEGLKEYGLCYGDVEKSVNDIKSIFIKEDYFFPLEISLLLHKKAIGKEKYVLYRRKLYERLDRCLFYCVIDKLGEAYFKDRVLARHVLKWGCELEYLKMYQDDDAMVRYCLKHDGCAIVFASERIRTDYEWIKYAILHSERSTIMKLECMEPYRNDRELIYLACKKNLWNFEYASEDLKNDYEFVKKCMELGEDVNGSSVYHFLSPEMKRREEFIWMDLNTRRPSISDYPDEWRDSDELAAKLYELRGTKNPSWYSFSERLKNKYGIKG